MRREYKDERISYDVVYDLAQELLERMENCVIPDIKLLSFRDYVTPEGVYFPNKEAEQEFKKRVNYPNGASQAIIVKMYALALKMAIAELNPTRSDSQQGGLEDITDQTD